MKTLTLLASLVLLTACSSDASLYRAADHRMLCDDHGRAYMISPHVGDTSVVVRTPSADATCEAVSTVRRDGVQL